MGYLNNKTVTVDAILTKKFTVKISKRYSLKEAAQAHKDLEARMLTGPAVIVP